nr:hypothetical protein [Tanacetum cinerariifolium]
NFSAAGSSSPHPDTFIPANTLQHVDQDDSQIPDLEDTAKLQIIGIFNSAYDDDLDRFDSPVQSVGVEADFNNMGSFTIRRTNHKDYENMVACLERTEANADFHQILDFLSTCSINYALTEISSGDRPWCQETTLGDTDAQTRFETASIQSHDLPLLEVNTSGSKEDSMEHPNDLTDFVPPTPHDSPLLGGHTPGSRVETSTDKSLGEDASQGRNDDKTEEINLTDGADTEVHVEDKGSGKKVVVLLIKLNIARPATLIKLRSEKEKEKRVAFRDVEEPPRLTRSTTTLQPLPTIDPKDKGKGVLVVGQSTKKRQKQEEATIAALTEEFDEIQAKMDVDHELDVRMTHEEQEKYTIEERARLLAEYFERKKETIGSRKIRGNKEQTTYKNSSQEQDNYLPQTYRIRRWHYNLIPAESKFKNPMLDYQDKFMMKAQVHVSKSSAISDEQALPQRKHHC